MLDGILDNVCITLVFWGRSETLDASNRVIYEVINKILINDLLLIDNLCGKSDYNLRMIYKASLHNFWKLRDQRLFFEQKIVRAFLCVYQYSSHRLKKIVEDLLKVGCLVQHCRGSEYVTIENLQEKLHVASWETEDWPRILNCQEWKATFKDSFKMALTFYLWILFIVFSTQGPYARA
jgi:hypothetical protein